MNLTREKKGNTTEFGNITGESSNAAGLMPGGIVRTAGQQGGDDMAAGKPS